MLKPKKKKRARRSLVQSAAATIVCPSCWQELEITIDYSAGSNQSFTHDCEVCCRPLLVTIEIGETVVASAVLE